MHCRAKHYLPMWCADCRDVHNSVTCLAGGEMNTVLVQQLAYAHKPGM